MRTGWFMVAVLLTALLLGPTPGFARGGGGSWHGGARAGHASGAWHGHGGFHGHGGGGIGVVIAPSVWWGDPWWWGPPGPYYGYPYGYPYYGSPYYAPPVETPQTYIQQAPPQPSYWYYCPDSKMYYPYVKECPSGWLTVVPPSTAPATAPTPSSPPQ